jgi:hypothetical protein
MKKIKNVQWKRNLQSRRRLWRRRSRPGSELQFFPWISGNRNTNLVIKKMIKSF